ncbi:MAG: hypothetical protein A2133_00865 [Actinobacteria bacterium RBG_16_64_13]|nr:MAG: hypothetical protein A2133_00865 [Actinobacteria bacterium RBG_16_64_13]
MIFERIKADAEDSLQNHLENHIGCDEVCGLAAQQRLVLALYDVVEWARTSPHKDHCSRKLAMQPVETCDCGLYACLAKLEAL